MSEFAAPTIPQPDLMESSVSSRWSQLWLQLAVLIVGVLGITLISASLPAPSETSSPVMAAVAEVAGPDVAQAGGVIDVVFDPLKVQYANDQVYFDADAVPRPGTQVSVLSCDAWVEYYRKIPYTVYSKRLKRNRTLHRYEWTAIGKIVTVSAIGAAANRKLEIRGIAPLVDGTQKYHGVVSCRAHNANDSARERFHHRTPKVIRN